MFKAWFDAINFINVVMSLPDQDTGPQLPTNITAMLKYGINLFQVVGQFNGMSNQTLSCQSIPFCLKICS
jgi:hypothetical protein